MFAGAVSPLSYLRSWRKPLVFAAFAMDDPLPGIVDLPIALSRVLVRHVSGLGACLSNRNGETSKSLVRSLRNVFAR
jgi:predicted ATP-grasp superfamily ATP-dependent carboligase